MSSPLFQMFGNNQNGGFGIPFEMIQQFNQFANGFRGDPRQQVVDLLNSGRMSQQQFNRLSAMAQQFQQLIGRRY